MNNIRKARALSGMSQAKLAAALGVSERTLRSYEAGAPVPSTVLAELARITGCSVDFMLGLSVWVSIQGPLSRRKTND